MLLGIIQQVALVPVLLHFWSGEELAAWLVIYAIGNLALIADCGLQFLAPLTASSHSSRAPIATAAPRRSTPRCCGSIFGSADRAGRRRRARSALVVSPSTAFRFEGSRAFRAPPSW